MTPFWQGFISAVALIAVAVIVLSVVMYRRQERQRQQAVDAIMAKVAASADTSKRPYYLDPDLTPEERHEIFVKGGQSYYDTQVRDSRVPHMAPPSGKKGLH